MPGFCTNCGAPLSGAFCVGCGQRAQSPTPQAAATQPQPAPATAQGQQGQAHPPLQPATGMPGAQKSAGPGKGLLIVGGVVLVFGLAAFGAVVFGVHWFKSKVSVLTGGAMGGVRITQGNICKLLSPQEVQQVLGVAVERSAEIMENNDPGCAYYTNPAAFTELRKAALEQARRDSERVSKDPAVKNSKDDNPLSLLNHTEEMEGMVKGLGALSQPDQDGRVFAFSVDKNFGAGNWNNLRLAMSVVPGFKEIDGVGDHAMIGSFGHAFYVLKGDSVVHLDTIYVPETRVRGAELGRKIVSHF